MGVSNSSSAATRPLSQNRRRSKRHALDIPATLFTENDANNTVAIKVTELSVAGVGFTSPKHLEPGQVYQLNAFDSLIPQGARVRIVSSRPGANGRFEIGGEVC